jgi:hypothetical protein
VGSAELDFGKVVVGNFSELSLELSNNGDLPVEGLMTISSPGFTLQPAAPDSIHVGPGGSLMVVMRFTPASPMPYGGFLAISSNSSGGVRMVALRGVGLPLPVHHRVWLDTTSARAGEQTHLRLLVSPPLTPIDSATDMAIRLRYDPSALWLIGASIVAAGNGGTRPVFVRPDDSTVEISVGKFGVPLEGSEPMRIDLVGLSTGYDLNWIRIDSVRLGGTVVDSVDAGLVLLQGCSRRLLPVFSRRSEFEAITIDGALDEAEIRYHGPEGITGSVRLANNAGEIVKIEHLPPCTGGADRARLVLRELPTGIYFLELAIAEDRSVIPLLIGR